MTRRQKVIRLVTLAAILTLGITIVACGDDQGAETTQATGGATTTTPAMTATTAPGTSETTDSTAGSGSPQKGGILNLVTTAEGGLPLGVPWETTGIDTILMGPCVETLGVEDSEGNVHPWLATDWEVDQSDPADPKITLNLRQGVKFHDGTDFNAEAARWVIDEAIKANMMAGFESVEAMGEHRLVIHLDAFRNTALTKLASRTIGMVSPTAFQKNGIESSRWNPVGTGPFKFESLERGNVLKYTRNENYWDAGKPHVDGVWFHFIRDPMTAQAALASTGEQAIDVISTLSAEQGATLLDTIDGLYVLSNSIGPISLIPDSAKPASPLANKTVRFAISHAIDREGIVQARGFGQLTPAYQWIPERWNASLPNFTGTPYDPEKAKQLLAEAGYPNGFATKIIVMPGMIDKEAMVAVQNQLGAVGIEVELEFPDSGGYANYRFNGWDGFMAMHTRVLSNYNQSCELYWLVSGKQWPDLQRPAGLEDAITASAKTEKMDSAAGQKISQIIADDMMIIPIYNVNDYWVCKDSVHDFGFGDWGGSTWALWAEGWLEQE